MYLLHVREPDLNPNLEKSPPDRSSTHRGSLVAGPPEEGPRGWSPGADCQSPRALPPLPYTKIHKTRILVQSSVQISLNPLVGKDDTLWIPRESHRSPVP